MDPKVIPGSKSDGEGKEATTEAVSPIALPRRSNKMSCRDCQAALAKKMQASVFFSNG